MNDKEKQLEKARRHNESMKKYYASHPEQRDKNRTRARERQRRLSAEKKPNRENNIQE